MKLVRSIECHLEPSNVGWLAEFWVETADVILRNPLVVFLRDHELRLMDDFDVRYPKGNTFDEHSIHG